MSTTMPDIRPALTWQEFKLAIRAAAEAEREQLLLRLGDDIRVLAAPLLQAFDSLRETDPSLSMATCFGVLVAGVRTADPHNPDWKARDRLFLTRPEDMLPACAALALLGFFTVESLPEVVGADGKGQAVPVPGLDAPGQPPHAVAMAAWESALESRRSKRRWRDSLKPGARTDWANPQWLDFSGVWRSYIVLDARDPVAEVCRDLPLVAEESQAGLVALIATDRDGAQQLAAEWRESGWGTLTVSKTDPLGIYQALTAPAGADPLAVILSAGYAAEHATSTRIHSRRSRLLGELSDAQFHELIDGSLDF